MDTGGEVLMTIIFQLLLHREPPLSGGFIADLQITKISEPLLSMSLHNANTHLNFEVELSIDAHQLSYSDCAICRILEHRRKCNPMMQEWQFPAANDGEFNSNVCDGKYFGQNEGMDCMHVWRKRR